MTHLIILANTMDGTVCTLETNVTVQANFGVIMITLRQMRSLG